MRVGAALDRLGILLAYCCGAIVAGIGIMSAVSIIGRSALNRPITGDFELVEIGTAISGTLFLPYCQATRGHIIVDLFTLRASERTRGRLDRFGSLQDVREAAEREYILKKLEETNGNVTRTAELLGLERSNLYRKMRTLGIGHKE